MSSYPLGQSEADTITSRTGKKLSQITLDEVKKGNVTADDIKISAETLKKQGQVAKEADNPTMDANFQRAAELVNVPDDIILDMKNISMKKVNIKHIHYFLLEIIHTLTFLICITNCVRIVQPRKN